LTAAVPQLDAFPRARLANTPTPIEEAPRLGSELGIRLFIKRDDCTGLAFGGNKVRQLEFYLGAAKAEHADTVLITGAVQSNFARLAAAGARRLGMDIHIQLEERVPDIDAVYRRSGNVLLDGLLGAQLHSYPEGEDEAGADAALDALAERLVRAGRRPYAIKLGVDHPPVGGLGYVVAAAELAGQIAPPGLSIDVLVVASGSGLTHGGLLAGLRVLGMSTRIVGVCVRRDAERQRARVLRRAREIAGLLGRDDAVGTADVVVIDSVLEPGYGRLNTATLSAMRLAARTEGLVLDPVYSGKAMAGLAELARKGRLRGHEGVLFVHTGGEPALFGYQRAVSRFLDEASVSPHRPRSREPR